MHFELRHGPYNLLEHFIRTRMQQFDIEIQNVEHKIRITYLGERCLNLIIYKAFRQRLHYANFNMVLK